MSSDSSPGNGRQGNGRPPTPTWLDLVRRLERAIGGPVERALTSETYFDLLPLVRRAYTQVEETVASVTDEWYRLLNVPTGRDVRQLRTQLARMERQLERLVKQLDDAEASPKRPAARKRDTTD
jgi:hypothetical protein